jgi:hypothetical protein
VTTAAAVGAGEVQVVAGDLDPLDVGGEAKAEHRPLDLGQIEDVLVGDDLGQRAVRRVLPGDRAGANAGEAAVEANRAGGGASGDKGIEARQQLFVAELVVRQALLHRRLEAGDHRKRRPLLRRNPVEPAVDVGAEELAVDRDHLAVELVEGPQPEVAVLRQLSKAEIALEGAVEQRPDRRGLEENVRLTLTVQVGAAHRLHVQRPDPALVQHRRQSANRADRLPPAFSANPKLALGLIFGFVGILVLVLLLLQRADLEHAAGGDRAARSRAAAEGGRPLEDPTAVTEAELWAALAISSIDRDSIKAQEETWDVGRRSKLGAVVFGLILLTVLPAYLLESFVPFLIGVPLIVIAALYGAFRAIGPGGEVDQGYEGMDGAMKPLGLQVTARPQGGFEPRGPAMPGFDYRLHGVTELSGERSGRQVTVRFGSHEDAGHSEVAVIAVCNEFAVKSKRVEVRSGPGGVVICRRKAHPSDWLCDLWVAERLAST